MHDQVEISTGKLNLFSGANERSFRILASANDFGGWICKTYFKIMGTISGLSFVTSVVSVWVCCKTYGRFDAQYAMHTDRVM